MIFRHIEIRLGRRKLKGFSQYSNPYALDPWNRRQGYNEIESNSCWSALFKIKKKWSSTIVVQNNNIVQRWTFRKTRGDVKCMGRYWRHVSSEKRRDLTQSYDKSPYTRRKIEKAMWQHKNATKDFDYITIADRLRTVSFGNDSHPTGVVKPDYGIPTFPLNAKAV